MAAIAMMIGGAILNATAFVGGNYLAKSLSGHNVDTEKIRHDKALEKYQRDYAEYQKKRQEMLDWKMKKKDEKYQASKNISTTNKLLNCMAKCKSQNSLIITNQAMNKKQEKWYMLELEC